jgi:hypothetical protein
VVEGGYLAKEKEMEVSAIDGGTSVCLEVGGCGLGPDCFVTEVGQFGALSEHAVGAKGKFGVCSEFANSTVGGVLTPVTAISSVAITVGLTDTFQHETKRDEERLGDSFFGGDIEGPQLFGQMGAIISMGHLGEMVGSKFLSSMEAYDVKYEVSLLQDVVDGEGEGLEDSGPLSIVPLAVSVGKEPISSVSPRLVVERVKGFYKVVGLSCDRFEDKLMTLFEEIEATRDQTIA